jgi:hypothetical protein
LKPALIDVNVGVAAPAVLVPNMDTHTSTPRNAVRPFRTIATHSALHLMRFLPFGLHVEVAVKRRAR